MNFHFFPPYVFRRNYSIIVTKVNLSQSPQCCHGIQKSLQQHLLRQQPLRADAISSCTHYCHSKTQAAPPPAAVLCLSEWHPKPAAENSGFNYLHTQAVRNSIHLRGLQLFQPHHLQADQPAGILPKTDQPATHLTKDTYTRHFKKTPFRLNY